MLDYFSKEIELKKETLYNWKMVQAQDGVSVESDTLGALLYPLEGDTFALMILAKLRDTMNLELRYMWIKNSKRVISYV